jgi:hypothetical protein
MVGQRMIAVWRHRGADLSASSPRKWRRLLVAALVCLGGCQAPRPARSGSPEQGAGPAPVSVAADVRLLRGSDFDAYVGAARRLRQAGRSAIPAVAGLLGDANPPTVLGAITVLDDIGDRDAVPWLLKVVDRAPGAEFSAATSAATSNEGLAIYAKEAIVHIVNPVSRQWFGADVGAPPGSEAFTVRQQYFRRVGDFFDGWRVGLREKGVGANSPPDSGTYDPTTNKLWSTGLS